MEFLKRPLAITDIETTGLDADIHELIELGLVLVDQKTFKVIDEFDIKIKPGNLKTAAPRALKMVGYSERSWLTALTLKEALEVYAEKAQNGIFVGRNVFTDWSFIARAFKIAGIEDPTDYHRVDIFTATWSKANRLPGLKDFTLEDICRYFGIKPEPKPNRAINGAYKILEVLKALAEI